jgi:hypothetical protein
MDALETAGDVLGWLIPLMVLIYVFLRYQKMGFDLHRIADAVEQIAKSETDRTSRREVS